MEDLSKLLEKIGEKYPDDKDVSAAIEMKAMEDDPEMEDEFDMEFPEEEPIEGEEAPVDMEALFSEDLEEEEDDEDMVSMPQKVTGAF